MKILVDADSCPVAAREMLCRAAEKRAVCTFFFANRALPDIMDAKNPFIVMEICPASPGSADDRLVDTAERGDLAVTRDVPLAARLVEKGIAVLDDRGRIFTADNIREYLSLRDWTVSLAESGHDFERSARRDARDHKNFAAAFDRLLTTLGRK